MLPGAWLPAFSHLPRKRFSHVLSLFQKHPLSEKFVHLELKNCFVMMRRLPRNPHPLSLGTIMALGHLQSPSCWRPMFGFPFQWNPLTRKSSFPPSLWLTLPAWNLPPQHPLLDSCTPPSRMLVQRVPPNRKLPVIN